jgi:hypothetical protein
MDLSSAAATYPFGAAVAAVATALAFNSVRRFIT